MRRDNPTPWTVYAALLRPGVSKARVVEIWDANGDCILPWAGFDGTGLSHARQKSLAARIVSAVNAVEEK